MTAWQEKWLWCSSETWKVSLLLFRLIFFYSMLTCCLTDLLQGVNSSHHAVLHLWLEAVSSTVTSHTIWPHTQARESRNTKLILRTEGLNCPTSVTLKPAEKKLNCAAFLQFPRHWQRTLHKTLNIANKWPVLEHMGHTVNLTLEFSQDALLNVKLLFTQNTIHAKLQANRLTDVFQSD